MKLNEEKRRKKNNTKKKKKMIMKKGNVMLAKHLHFDSFFFLILYRYILERYCVLSLYVYIYIPIEKGRK